MKRIFLVLIVGLSFVSCEDSEKISDNLVQKDPINGVSEYLLDSVFIKHSSLAHTIVFKNNYSPEGILEEEGRVVYPENLDSETKPYVTLPGQKLFCDSKRRVIKQEEDFFEETYTYDSKGRLQTSIRFSKDINLRDTLRYEYFEAGANNWNGTSFKITQGNKYVAGDGMVVTLPGKITHTYYLGDKKLKSWETLPYNHGKLIEYPVVKHVYTLHDGSLVTNNYTHSYNELGLIVGTSHSFQGGNSEHKFTYKKK